MNDHLFSVDPDRFSFERVVADWGEPVSYFVPQVEGDFVSRYGDVRDLIDGLDSFSFHFHDSFSIPEVVDGGDDSFSMVVCQFDFLPYVGECVLFSAGSAAVVWLWKGFGGDQGS